MRDIEPDQIEELARQEVARARARTLAGRMPLCHFPATTPLRAWSAWTSFKSRSERSGGGPSVDPSPFQRLLDDHIFAYAGPCCFAEPQHNGDAVAFFGPDAALDAGLSASPFDTGTLGPKKARLQPYAETEEAERWAFLERHRVDGDWRGRFEAWLAAAYAEPDRYLETSTGDRHRDGRPDRLPAAPEILEHNSSRHHAEGVRCADRRAWTWEVRRASELPLAHISLLWVAPDAVQDVASACLEAQSRGKVVDLEVLDPSHSATGSAFYVESGTLLARRIGSERE